MSDAPKRGFEPRTGESDRKISEALSASAGGVAHDAMPALEVERTPQAEAEAFEEIRRQTREAGCTCEPIKIDKRIVVVRGQTAFHILVLHKSGCPLGEEARA